MGCKRKEETNVAGVMNHCHTKVEATVDFNDLCRAVRQCLINDLVAGAENDQENHHHHKNCYRRRPVL